MHGRYSVSHALPLNCYTFRHCNVIYGMRIRFRYSRCSTCFVVRNHGRCFESLGRNSAMFNGLAGTRVYVLHAVRTVAPPPARGNEKSRRRINLRSSCTRELAPKPKESDQKFCYRKIRAIQVDRLSNKGELSNACVLFFNRI